MGDGGSGNDPGQPRAEHRRAARQDPAHRRRPARTAPHPYSSPPSNPFFGATPGRDEICAFGLRNPWRFSFDRGTGAALGRRRRPGRARRRSTSSTRGGNYGWRVCEGTHCTGIDPRSAIRPASRFPIAEYDHTRAAAARSPAATSIAARAGRLPAGTLSSTRDYCTGEIFQLRRRRASLLLDTALQHLLVRRRRGRRDLRDGARRHDLSHRHATTAARSSSRPRAVRSRPRAFRARARP